MGINPRICEGLSRLYGITFASKIQYKIITKFFENDSDLIAISETGSGKTLAYVIPILHAYLQTGAKSLIVTTHSILHWQIYNMIKDLLNHMEDIDHQTILGRGDNLHKLPITVANLHDLVRCLNQKLLSASKKMFYSRKGSIRTPFNII